MRNQRELIRQDKMFGKEFEMEWRKHPNGNILVTVVEDWLVLKDQGWRKLESVKIVGDH